MKAILVLLSLAGTAYADIASGMYKTVGGARYMETDDVPSCGKESREAMKDLAKAARTVTINSTSVRMNDGEPMKIDKRTKDTVSGMRVIDSPTADFPDRKTALSITIHRIPNGDQFVSVTRLVASGDMMCADTYARSLD